jgi:uncharacterized protein (DUF302 family)
MKTVSYGHSRTFEKLGFDEVLQRVISRMKEEGFGALTEIDVQATLKQKLGVERRPYKILGACNPPLAHKALTVEPEIGLLLPCNVVVAEEEDGRISAAVISPKALFSMVDNPALVAVAADVEARLLKVLDGLD